MIAEIKAIIFDLQGVVIGMHSDAEYFQHLSKVSGKPAEFFMSAPFINNWTAVEKGEKTFDEFISTSMELSGLTAEQIDWVGFYKARAKLNTDVVSLIKALRCNYKVVALTNADPGRYAAASEIFDQSMFDEVYTSFSLGARKPDRNVFIMVLDGLGVGPSEALYIDDRQENVDGAEAVGINSILFKDAEALTGQLNALGINLRK